MKKIKLSGKKLRVTFCAVIAVLVSISVCVGTANAARTFRGSDNKKSKVKTTVKANAKTPMYSLMCSGSAGAAQNDIGTGSDASNSFTDATRIPAASHVIKLGDYEIIIGYHLAYQGYTRFWGTGYIDNDLRNDPYDFYKVWVEGGQTLSVYMESLRLDSDYDLELLNVYGGQIAKSDNGYYEGTNVRMPEQIVYLARCSNYYIIKVYVNSLSPAQTWPGCYFMSVGITDP